MHYKCFNAHANGAMQWMTSLLITNPKEGSEGYRIHHRQRPITAGLFRTGGDSLSPPVPNGPSGDA